METKAKLIFKQMQIGPMENFEYFIGDTASKEVAIVDPAWDVDYLREEAKRLDYKITKVFLTHGHPDHTNGIPDLLATHDIPVYISKYELEALKPKTRNLVEVDRGAKLTIGSIIFDCLHTPGHSPGGQCFKYGDTLIAGDTLFIDGCGRCDLPGSDPKQMYHSLYHILMELPDSTVIFPGHDYGPAPYATLRAQKKTNTYLKANNMDDFLRTRMGIGVF